MEHKEEHKSTWENLKPWWEVIKIVYKIALPVLIIWRLLIWLSL